MLVNISVKLPGISRNDVDTRRHSTGALFWSHGKLKDDMPCRAHEFSQVHFIFPFSRDIHTLLLSAILVSVMRKNEHAERLRRRRHHHWTSLCSSFLISFALAGHSATKPPRRETTAKLDIFTHAPFALSRL